MTTLKNASSMGFVSLPEVQNGYKGVWYGELIYIPFYDDNWYPKETVFQVDNFSQNVRTCNVYIKGKTAFIEETVDQNYTADFIDKKLIIYDLK